MGTYEAESSPDDELIFLIEDDIISIEETPTEDPGPVEMTTESWNILVVDDDQAVQKVTKLALHNLQVRNREIELLPAYSATEAMELLSTLPDTKAIAVAVVDVVMESEFAGLEFVEWMRAQPAYSNTRIVIRTGQPGTAPEEQILRDLDINDYWAKTEITARRMRTLITGLLRSYRDLSALETQRVELRRMIQGLGDIQSRSAMNEILDSLLSLIKERFDASDVSLAFLEVPSNGLHDARIMTGTGPFASVNGSQLNEVLSEQQVHLLEASRSSGQLERGRRDAAFIHVVEGGRGSAFIATGFNDMDDWTQDTLTLLCRNALSLINTLILADEQAQMSRSAGRFVPKGLVNWLGASSIMDLNFGMRREIKAWILFCDLRGFTSLAESLGIAETYDQLLQMFSLLVPIVRKHGGVIDKFTGDGLMAMFSGDEPPLACCLELEEAVRTSPALDGLMLSVGLHGGTSLLCTLGYRNRMDVTAVGDTVNVAARLEQLTRRLGGRILISEVAFEAAPDDARQRLRSLGRHRPRGRSARIGVYQLITDAELPSVMPPAELDALNQALHNEEPDATLRFQRALQMYPRDDVLRFLAESVNLRHYGH